MPEASAQHSSSTSRSSRSDERRLGVHVCGAALFLVALMLVAFPCANAFVRVARWLLQHHDSVDPLPASRLALLSARTGAYVLGIGLLATLLAIPAAWLLRANSVAAGARIAAVACVPLLMPHYLAYSGWGLIRGPRTLIGDWLSTGAYAELKLTLASRFVAVWGLSLWAWPLAAFVLAPSMRRLTPDLLESLRLDGGAWHRRLLVPVRLMLPGALASTALVALIMLGSVVPLDVAQIETLSINLLRMINQREHVEDAWITGWPVFMLAVGTALLLCRRLSASPLETDYAGERDTRGMRQTALVGAIAVWALSVIVPIALFIYNMREPPNPPTLDRLMHLSRAFWRDALPAVKLSGRVALAVAGAGVLIALASWAIISATMTARSSRGRTFAGDRKRRAFGLSGAAGVMFQLTAFLFLLGGLMPGTFIGSSAARAWNQSEFLRHASTVFGSHTLVAFVHIARFGFVALLLGWHIARQEPGDERDLRRLDGATDLRGWIRVCLAPNWIKLLGVAGAMFALSFHEIEATVQVQPPGPQAMAQMLLDWLHYARDEYLAAAAVNLLAGAGLLGLAVGYVLYPRREARRD